MAVFVFLRTRLKGEACIAAGLGNGANGPQLGRIWSYFRGHEHELVGMRRALLGDHQAEILVKTFRGVFEPLGVDLLFLVIDGVS